jgi:hypothetical protein
MSTKGVGLSKACANSELSDGCGTIRDDGVTAGEAEAIEMLAEVLVDAMLRLEQEHGLTPKQMQEYFTGHLDLNDGEEGT